MGLDLQSRISGARCRYTERIHPRRLEEVRADALEAIVHTMDKIKAMVIAAGALVLVLRLFGGREVVPGVVSTICDHILATWEKTCSCSAFCPQHLAPATAV